MPSSTPLRQYFDESETGSIDEDNWSTGTREFLLEGGTRLHGMGVPYVDGTGTTVCKDGTDLQM
jgi:hypothetical protein